MVLAVYSGRLDRTKPIPPCQIAGLNQYGFVFTMISETFEEYSATKRRYLEGVDIDVDTIVMPSVGADSV
jgi:hypothetical protein